MRLILNGNERELPELQPAAPLSDLVALLGFRQDRVAVELNHEIAPRSGWPTTTLQEGDRVEVVHFVGGGAGQEVGPV